MAARADRPPGYGVWVALVGMLVVLALAVVVVQVTEVLL